MSNEITLSTLGDSIRDKVRKVLFDSIPEETIQKMIEKEWNDFAKDSSTETWNGNKYTKKSLLGQLVETETKKQISERMNKLLLDYVNGLDLNEKDVLKEYMKEISPMILVGLSESFAKAATQTLRNELNNKGIYL